MRAGSALQRNEYQRLSKLHQINNGVVFTFIGVTLLPRSRELRLRNGDIVRD